MCKWQIQTLDIDQHRVTTTVNVHLTHYNSCPTITRQITAIREAGVINALKLNLFSIMDRLTVPSKPFVTKTLSECNTITFDQGCAIS